MSIPTILGGVHGSRKWLNGAGLHPWTAEGRLNNPNRLIQP